MSVNWQWKNKMGTFTENECEMTMYRGSNCLAVMLYEWTNEKGENYFNFGGFWNDIDHLKTNLGINKKRPECKNLYTLPIKMRLNTRFKESKKIAEQFLNALPEVSIELYYEPEPEEEEKGGS